MTNPGLQVNWDPAVLFADHIDFSFVEYNLYRRRAPYEDVFGQIISGPYTRISRIADYDTTEYTDYEVASGVEYQYGVTFWGDNGLGVVQSELSETAVGSVTFKDAVLHDINNPTVYYVNLAASVVSVQQTQNQLDLHIWGRREGITHIGERFERQFDLRAMTQTSNVLKDQLEILLDRQYGDSAIYCLRIAHTQEVVRGIIRPTSRSHSTAQYDTGFVFQERHAPTNL